MFYDSAKIWNPKFSRQNLDLNFQICIRSGDEEEGDEHAEGEAQNEFWEQEGDEHNEDEEAVLFQANEI